MVGNSLSEMFDTELSLAFAILPKELLNSKHSIPSILGTNNLGELFEIMLELHIIHYIFQIIHFLFVIRMQVCCYLGII